MLSLFPNSSAPFSGWLATHQPLVILLVVVLIAFVALMRFAQPGGDAGGYDDWFADCDGADGSSCE